MIKTDPCYMTLPVIAAMGLVVVMWAITAAACQGWGTVVARTILHGQYSTARASSTIWIGFAVLLGMLQIWHLFLPVDWRTTGALLGGGLAIWWSTGAYKAWKPGSLSWVGCTCLALLSLWLANRGLDFARNYDSGLYHFSAIRWINEYPIVPGLANLHDRLGFNQSYFLFVALLNVHPFFNEGYHVANSLLVLLLSSQLFRIAWLMMQTPTTPDIAAILQSVLLPIVVVQGISGNISSPSPDLAVFVCGVAAFVALVQTLSTPLTENDEKRLSIVVLVALSTLGCTLKLSFAAFGFAACGVALWSVRKTLCYTSWMWLTVGVIFLGLPYIIRGIILSGYPAFPSTFFPWPTDWCLTTAETQETANWIRSWGRQPGIHWREVLGSWNWFGIWWSRTMALPEVCLPFVLSLVSFTISAASILLSPIKQNDTQWWWRSFTPILVGLAAWFLTAPDPRFANWLIWLAAAWPLTCAIWLHRQIKLISITRTLALVVVVAAMGLPTIQPRLWIGLCGHKSAWIAQPIMKTFTTDSGLNVFIPADDTDVRPWDAPLPSAPLPKPGLELRGVGLEKGFRTHPHH